MLPGPRHRGLLLLSSHWVLLRFEQWPVEVMDVAWSVSVLFERCLLLTMNNEENPGLTVFRAKPVSTRFPVNGIRVGGTTLRDGEGFPKSFA